MRHLFLHTFRLFLKLSILFLAVLGLMLCIPKFMGIQNYTVLSSSMEPALPVGSLVFTSQYTSEDQLQEGDIIAFSDGEALVIHRIAAVDQLQQTIVTKGDHNRVPDAYPVSFKDITGKYIFHIPYLGFPAFYLSALPPLLLAFLFCCLAVLESLSGHFSSSGDSHDMFT